MGYDLKFEAEALQEWKALDNSVREPLKKKLAKRLEQPHIPGQRLHGDLASCYKIKNDKTGHRLIYQVLDADLVVMVLAIEARADLKAYRLALERLKDSND